MHITTMDLQQDFFVSIHQCNLIETYCSSDMIFFSDNYTGNCADWVKKKLNVPVVFTIYLQQGEHVFPEPKHIEPLVDQFSAILTNTMAIAGNIYGPLFNSYTKNTSSILIYIAFFVTVI